MLCWWRRTIENEREREREREERTVKMFARCVCVLGSFIGCPISETTCWGQ